MAFVVSAQFAFLQHLMAKSKRSNRELIAIPFVWAFVAGTTMGLVEVITNP